MIVLDLQNDPIGFKVPGQSLSSDYVPRAQSTVGRLWTALVIWSIKDNNKRCSHRKQVPFITSKSPSTASRQDLRCPFTRLNPYPEQFSTYLSLRSSPQGRRLCSRESAF